MKHEPFVTQELRKAVSAMGAELQKSYEGVSVATTEFVNSFRVCDTPLLVAAMEAITEAIKNNFDKHDEVLYKLVTMPRTTTIVTTIPIRREGSDDKS